jgi:hypothetical protein
MEMREKLNDSNGLLQEDIFQPMPESRNTLSAKISHPKEAEFSFQHRVAKNS